MSFVITGYVLEPPRVGQSNSPFTSTPNVFVNQANSSDVAAYAAAYPSSETNPRTDYLVIATTETVIPPLILSTPPALLVNAGFGWTKNEIIQRFDYDGHGGRFKPMPGGAIVTVGTLGATSNTTRLKAKPPVQLLTAAPYRLSIGGVGSGITQTVSLVLNDGAFGTPPPGTTELSQATGNLNWNTADLATYDGQAVRWQQQQFFKVTSTGNIGTLVNSPLAPAILLNPIPGHGQLPLLRFGFTQPWLHAVEVPDEFHFTPFPGPSGGTVEWALDTGRLNFSNNDVVHQAGTSVYYDGVLFARDLTLPRQSLGVITAPSSITLPSPTTGDLIFCVPLALPFYQFPQYELVKPPNTFDANGTQGIVQINQSTGAVQFSVVDQSLFAGLSVTLVSGDLPIERGISLRLFRSPVDLDAQSVGVKDVTTTYAVENATWANPITGSPLVFLPATPLDDNTLQVTVNQGLGSFVGTLNPVDIANPLPGPGYILDFETGQFTFGNRVSNVLVPILQPAVHVQLPDTLVLSTNIFLSIETGPGTGVFNSLTPGVDVLVEATPGIIDFINTVGVPLASGSAGTFSGTTFTDAQANFTTENVQVGNYLIVQSGYAVGVYTITAIPTSTSLVVDVAPPAGSGPLAYEVLSGKEILLDRFFQPVQPTDPTTSVERIRSLGTIQNATVIHDSGATTATFPNLSTLSDSTANFLTSGVLTSDTLSLPSGTITPSSTLRLVLAITQNTLTPTATFRTVAASTYRVSRRLQIPISAIGSVRFRFGQTTFSTTVNVVANDGLFSDPSTLVSGTVEISQATGNLNFAQADVTAGGTVFWVRRLALSIDYQAQPQLGLIQFTQRLLQNEEVLLTYTQAPPPPDLTIPSANSTATTAPPAVPTLFQNERGTFLVRKELTQPHPTPTTTLSFNPSGKSVATTPPARVFRGGRPQVTGTQVTINPANPSSMTFLPDDTLTDVIPHGATVQPQENVYIDYYIYQAMGGERTLTVLNPPLLTPQVDIVEGDSSFIITGDQTDIFPSNFILRINNNELYEIGTVTFDPVANQTTVNLSGAQTFQSDQTSPPLFVTSGPTPLTSAPFAPAYFIAELQPYATIPRGAPSFILPTDRTAAYKTNTVLYFTDQPRTFTDFYIVTAATYDPVQDQTTITIAGNAERQYTLGSSFLSYSVRPIVEQATSVVHTSNPPVMTQPIVVFRRVAGQVGQVLTSPTGYTIDASGTVTFKPPALLPNEEFSNFYTGTRTVQAGLRLQASYSCSITPDDNNGLLNQILSANYSLLSPDSFYFRVETMTNFKGEVSQSLQAQAQSGTSSSGPMTSNISQPQLFTQGQPSLWFPEGHYANVDIINRTCLKFFNDAVNCLEDALHAIDGRVVGDADGRFLFDANLNNPPRMQIPFFLLSTVTNQIDDILLPPFTFPIPLPLLPAFEQPVYVAGPYSRFYTTVRNTFAVAPITWSPASPPPADNTPITQFTFSNLTTLPEITFKRVARAQIQFDYPPGTTTFVVDNANATSDGLSRPSFSNGATTMRVMILAVDGTPLLPDSMKALVVAISAPPPAKQTITISVPAPTFIPAGSTITTATGDADNRIDSSQNGYSYGYKVNHEVYVISSTGQVQYRNREFPFNGTFDFFPPLNPIGLAFNWIDINPVQLGDILEMDGVGCGINYTSPYEFPALTGGTTNDDGNQAIPIVGPTFDGELNPAGGGPLNIEALNEVPTSALRNTLTTPPFLGTGSLDVTGTIITLTAGLFPSPAPKQFDLVRIVSGVNGQTAWRRITSVQNTVAPGSVTVATPDAFAVDAHFSFAVAVSSVNLAGTCTLSGITLTDTSAVFIAIPVPTPPDTVPMVGAAAVTATAQVSQPGTSNASMDGVGTLTATATVIYPPTVFYVAAGWTVVMTSGPNVGLRRQIVAILDATDLLIDAPFPSGTGGTYKINNPLNTYNGPAYFQLLGAVNTEISAISTRTPPTPPPYVPNSSSEENALLSFFSTAFTNVLGPSTCTVSGTTLTDTSVDFVAAGVKTSHLVYVHVGNSGAQYADMGVYQIATVVDSHHLTLVQAVPSAGAVTYEAVKIFGVSFKTLNKLFSILAQNITFVAQTQSFQTILSTSVPVLEGPGEFADGLSTTGDDLGNRFAQVTGRLGYLATTNAASPVTIIQGTLNSADQLYKKRYSWIDARINLQSGTVVLLAQAALARFQAQVQVITKLIQLLTVQSS